MATRENSRDVNINPIWEDGHKFGYRYNPKMRLATFELFLQAQSSNPSFDTTSIVKNLITTIAYTETSDTFVDASLKCLHHLAKHEDSFPKVNWSDVVYELGSMIFSDEFLSDGQKFRDAITVLHEQFNSFDLSASRDNDGLNLLMYCVNAAGVDWDLFNHVLNLDGNPNAKSTKFGHVIHFLNVVDPNMVMKLKALLNAGADPVVELSFVHYSSQCVDTEQVTLHSLLDGLAYTAKEYGDHFMGRFNEAADIIHLFESNKEAMEAGCAVVEEARKKRVSL